MFFVLSGFLIVQILYRSRVRVDSGMSDGRSEWIRFVTRRAFRIFPIYYLFLAVFLPIELFHHKLSIAAALMHVFYLVNIWIEYTSKNWNSTTTHLWSLSVEEQFYTFYSLISLLLPAKIMKYTCLILVIMGMIAFLFLSIYAHPFYMDLNPIISFSKIALGGLLGLTFGRRLDRSGSSSIGISVILTFYIVAPIVIGSASETYGLLWQAFPLTFLAALIIVGIDKNQSSMIVSLLDSRYFRFLGRISYGFYIYHFPLNVTFLSRIFNLQGSMIESSSYLRLAIDFLMPLAAATLSWYAIEAPIMRMRSREVPASPGAYPDATNADHQDLLATPGIRTGA